MADRVAEYSLAEENTQSNRNRCAVLAISFNCMFVYGDFFCLFRSFLSTMFFSSFLVVPFVPSSDCSFTAIAILCCSWPFDHVTSVEIENRACLLNDFYLFPSFSPSYPRYGRWRVFSFSSIAKVMLKCWKFNAWLSYWCQLHRGTESRKINK